MLIMVKTFYALLRDMKYHCAQKKATLEYLMNLKLSISAAKMIINLPPENIEIIGEASILNAFAPEYLQALERFIVYSKEIEEHMSSITSSIIRQQLNRTSFIDLIMLESLEQGILHQSHDNVSARLDEIIIRTGAILLHLQPEIELDSTINYSELAPLSTNLVSINNTRSETNSSDVGPSSAIAITPIITTDPPVFLTIKTNTEETSMDNTATTTSPLEATVGTTATPPLAAIDTQVTDNVSYESSVFCFIIVQSSGF